MTDQYTRLKAKGIDMSWLERGRASRRTADSAPLNDEECSNLSIYLVRKDGSLWTIDASAKPVTPYRKVREGKAEKPRELFVCVHSKRPYPTYEDAIKHGDCQEAQP